MKIALSEIWNFLELMDTDEKGWSYVLWAGNVSIEGISTETMLSLKDDPDYDTELLPSLFTFREILWQPDVFTEASMSIPSLRILQAYCKEVALDREKETSPVAKIYYELLKGLSECCSRAQKKLEKERADVKRVLGDFRLCAFPIIKFFIYHPQNRSDYFQDAQNRLNYAVKIMLTQFYGRYTELKDPYWVVNYAEKIPTEKPVEKQEKPSV